MATTAPATASARSSDGAPDVRRATRVDMTIARDGLPSDYLGAAAERPAAPAGGAMSVIAAVFIFAD